MLDLLNAGKMEAGACQFMETIAFGPGAWAQMSHELRATFVFNAATFLDEELDPQCAAAHAYGHRARPARHPP